MTPAFPPNSRTTFLRPARFFISQPTLGLPVKVIIFKRGSSTRGVAFLLEQGSTLRLPFIAWVFCTISPSNNAVSGVEDAGLIIIGLPHARAGATL